MMSRERKKAAALQEKLKILRSITHSHALSNTSIIMDASAYIKELKQKVVRLNQEIACAQDALRHKASSYPTAVGPASGDAGIGVHMRRRDRGSPRSAGVVVPGERVLRQELPGAARRRAGGLRRAGAQRAPGHRVLRRLLPPRGRGRR
ncbi:hypothetical protein ACJX0J_006668, partial [Zea mays]